MRAWMALGTMALLGGLLLAACAPPAPPGGTGVGFGSYADLEIERARRDAALRGAAPGTFPVTPGALPPPAGATLSGPVPLGGIPAADLAAVGIGVAPDAPSLGTPLAGPAAALPPVTVGASSANVGVAGLDPGRTGGLEASPANAAPALVGAAPALPSAPANVGGISDEQDFDAVSSRESIESDAARRAQQAAQYQVVQPQALPEAPADTGPNIVEYALAAPNARGQEWYSRFAFSGQGRADRNCARYVSPDEAQRDFLARGGPDRDPRGLDPDGDGFACAWDPAPFRAAVGR